MEWQTMTHLLLNDVRLNSMHGPLIASVKTGQRDFNDTAPFVPIVERDRVFLMSRFLPRPPGVVYGADPRELP